MQGRVTNFQEAANLYMAENKENAYAKHMADCATATATSAAVGAAASTVASGVSIFSDLLFIATFI